MHENKNSVLILIILQQVTNVVMNGKTEVSTMNQELSRFPSEFVLEDRQVQRVCSHPQEPEWVTNIKKGVISSFQSTILPEGTSLGFNVTEVRKLPKHIVL